MKRPPLFDDITLPFCNAYNSNGSHSDIDVEGGVPLWPLATPSGRTQHGKRACIAVFSRPPSIKHTRKNLGVRWTNKTQPIDEMAVTIETGGRIFVDPAGNLVVSIVNKYDESAYRCVHTASR